MRSRCFGVIEYEMSWILSIAMIVRISSPAMKRPGLALSSLGPEHPGFGKRPSFHQYNKQVGLSEKTDFS